MSPRRWRAGRPSPGPSNPTTRPGRTDGPNCNLLLERQHYQLVWWRAAADEINWRRFFDITTLAGLRVELATVFEATHTLIIGLYGEGLIDGVRIDHIDGLADPRAYCRKLRRRLEAAGAHRPPDAPVGEPYIVVEKILAPHEQLPVDWRTDGTTGYDFMDQVSALLHDPQGEIPLAALWSELTGHLEPYEAEETRRPPAYSTRRFGQRAQRHRRRPSSGGPAAIWRRATIP